MEYSEACSDVWCLLETLKQEELEKIPEKLIETIRILKLDNYNSKIDLNIPLEKQELSDATIGLISFIYKNYLGTKQDKEEYEMMYKENIKTIEDNENYSIEYKKENKEQNKEIKNEIVIHEEKSNIFLRLLNKIKKLFIK